MSFQLDCPLCGEEISARRDPQGQRVKCPHCQRTILWDADEESEVAEGGWYVLERQSGWIGFALVAFCIVGAPTLRMIRFPDALMAVKFAGAIVCLVCYFLGVVFCILGISRGRGETGGALGLLAAVLSFLLFAVTQGLK